jgi:hypothetical protein
MGGMGDACVAADAASKGKVVAGVTDMSGTDQTAAAGRPIEAIRVQIEDLEKKLAEIGARKDFNRQTRAESGPPINTTDKTNLGDLRLEQLRLAEEEIDMRAWLEQARRDLAAATKAEELAGDVELAKRRLELAGAFRRVGALLDEALTAQRCHAWLAVAQEMRMTRLSHETFAVGPTEQQCRVLGLQALLTMLKETPWAQEFAPIAPKDRRTFASLSDGWSASAERLTREFLTRAGVELEAPQAAEQQPCM